MFSNRKKVLFLIFLFGTVIFTEYCYSQGRQTEQKNIKYYYRISRLPTTVPDTTLLQFNLTIPYKSLIFISDDTCYSAGIIVNIFITDKDHNSVYDHSWRKTIKIDNYQSTNSDTTFQQFVTNTKIPAGEYNIVLEATDINIGIPEYNEVKIKIQDYSDKRFVLGDMLLFDGIHDFSEIDYRDLSPALTNVCRDDFTLFTQVFLLDSSVTLRCETNWFDNNRKAFKDPIFIARKGRTLTLFQSYSIKEALQGRFDVQFRVSGKGVEPKSTELSIDVIKNVDYYSEESIDMAIEQMKYIGEGEVWDSLRNAQEIDKKKYFFKRFWNDYYSVPDTSKNPVQEEYFRRVRHSNRAFNEGMEGWRTDRGRTYIMYGPPSDVEKTTDGSMRRIEIWTYQNVERQYVFIDVNGNGIFRLVRIN